MSALMQMKNIDQPTLGPVIRRMVEICFVSKYPTSDWMSLA